ncbi:MAG: hypothetical protein KDA89_16930 [Planctomycetaceae bacterium]|nr:hypothetical protein [Planctomycetaceae bacterium]
MGGIPWGHSSFVEIDFDNQSPTAAFAEEFFGHPGPQILGTAIVTGLVIATGPAGWAAAAELGGAAGFAGQVTVAVGTTWGVARGTNDIAFDIGRWAGVYQDGDRPFIEHFLDSRTGSQQTTDHILLWTDLSITVVEIGNVFIALKGVKALQHVGEVKNAVTFADEMAEVSANLCFTSDTVVKTEHGPKPIGRIDAGERVLAFDFDSGKWVPKRVVERLDSRHDGAIETIETDDGTFVSSTLYHPFWVVSGRDLADRPHCHELAEDENQGRSLEGRWVNSHDVQAGDILFDSQNNRRTVVRVSQEFCPGGTPVCNLMIEDLHNYSVGNAGILVHNTGWCDDAIRSLANRVKSGAATIDEVLEIGIESGIDQQSLRALIDDLAGAGIAPSPSVLAQVDDVLNHVTPPWPRELFTLQTNRGAGKVEHILEYTGQNNTGGGFAICWDFVLSMGFAATCLCDKICRASCVPQRDRCEHR